MVHGSWFMVHGSWFMVHGSWFMVHGSWFMVHGKKEFKLRNLHQFNLINPINYPTHAHPLRKNNRF